MCVWGVVLKGRPRFDGPAAPAPPDHHHAPDGEPCPVRRGERFGARGTLWWCGASVKPRRGKLGVFGGLGGNRGAAFPPPCADADKAKNVVWGEGRKGGSREERGGRAARSSNTPADKRPPPSIQNRCRLHGVSGAKHLKRWGYMAGEQKNPTYQF